MPAFLDVLAAVRTAMPGTTHLVGASGEDMSALGLRPGTVLWIAGTDVYAPPVSRGLPRARYTRTETVQVACWGIGAGRVRTAEDDMRAALALATSVIFAVEDAMGGSYRLSAGSWEANSPKAQMGRWYVLAFEFDAPVTRPQAQATVATVETETELALASGNAT
jgi:hypothetical protein